MSWTIKADIIEACSCAAVCPCILGPAKPDQGWCSGVFGISITEGTSDGVDLSGVKLVFHAELQGDFTGGIDKAKLYVDSGASEEQRREIDAIFHGERGGLWAGMKEGIGSWLPSTVTTVQFTNGGKPGVDVAGIGQITLEPITLEDGTPTTITGAPVLAAFGMTSVNVASGAGTKFSDPDMRAWESLGQGSTAAVVWTN